MAGENRTAASHLEASLRKKPYSYGFFQVMRLLECFHKDKSRFGQSARPVLEPPLRLGQEISLSFETSSLSGLISQKSGLAPVLKQRFLGLFGTNGPLPLHLTEYVHDRIHRYRDHTLEGFADMFHHRMACLFYRAFANVEPAVNFDRPETDLFSVYLGSLIGIGQSGLRESDAMPDLAKFHYSGFLSGQSKHAEGLKAMLADYFKLEVSIEQFVGEWLDIHDSDLTRLGESPSTGELGLTTIVGAKVWSCQHKFRICFGPLTLNEYRSLLPDGGLIEQLIAIIRNYTGDELNWDVQLVLKKSQVPSAQLSQHTRLGWTSWLGERQSAKDASELCLNPFWGKL